MKLRFTITAAALFAITVSKAQNTFPATGNVGIGTLTPSSTLHVVGTSRFGGNANNARFAANGSLSLVGTANYLVSGNRYVFQYATNTNYGLLFNSTDMRYEFLDAAQRPVFRVHADNGQGFLSGGLQISNSNENLLGNMRFSGTDFEGYDGSAWKSFTQKGWLLTGNTATNSATNFMGTIDYAPIVFKVNNTRAGYLGVNYGNTSFGYQSLLLDDDNDLNYNCAFGAYSLKSNLTGGNNTALGLSSLEFNSSGSGNSATGMYAMQYNTTGYGNTANGQYALRANTTGFGNTAIGDGTLTNSITGGSNTAVGRAALIQNTTGNSNTGIGAAALYFNLTGEQNTALGGNALSGNNIGSLNTAVGYNAMFLNTSGLSNTSLGESALYDNGIGVENTAVGVNAGRSNFSGSYNTSIGAQSGTTGPGFSNGTALGYQAKTTASNQVRIGNSSVTSIGGYKAWTNLSDGRVKKNIKANVPGLAFINLLKPVTYNLDLDAADKIMGVPVLKDKSGKAKQLSAEETNARKAQQETLCTGFIAQEVEASAKKLGYDFEGVDVPKNDKDLYGLRYSEFVVPLVKAVQELSKQNDALKDQNTELEDRLQKIEALLAGQTNSTVTGSASLQKVVISDGGSLDQNIPNPFKNVTTINYTLPQKYTSAKMVITDKSGKIIKQINVSGVGKGSVQLDAGNLSSGSYQYALLVDGKILGSKQMVLVK